MCVVFFFFFGGGEERNGIVVNEFFKIHIKIVCKDKKKRTLQKGVRKVRSCIIENNGSIFLLPFRGRMFMKLARSPLVSN